MNNSNSDSYIIPIGVDTFRELVTLKGSSAKKSLFIDKTQFIKEILNDGSKVILLTRPRRFGKTMNMSMLQHFLAKEVNGLSTKDLFNNLFISQDADVMRFQGKHPVIFITFKDAKSKHYAETEKGIREQIRMIYEEFRYLLDDEKISVENQKIYNQILLKESSLFELKHSLKNLSHYIYNDSGVKPYLLIDEYDTPIHTGYFNEYYLQIMDLLRELFSATLKGNANIEKGILTGITRIAKESVFSDLNNLSTHSVLDAAYAQYFGFTENEVDTLFSKANITIDKEQLRTWYNGYTFSNVTVYNPWSIMSCLKDNGKLKPYWVNTSSNELVIQLIINGGVEIHEKLEILLRGEVITEYLDEYIVFTGIEQNRSAIWTLLLMTGYLKVVSVLENNKCELAIPNKEVGDFYKKGIQNWLAVKNGPAWYQNFLEDLLLGKMEHFEKKLSKIIEETFSVRDADGREPERVYHAFMIGLLASLQETHEIKSNQESGLGYCDFLITPKDKNQYGLVLEFKAPLDAKHLQKESKNALQQIKDKKYVMQLQQKGIKNILLVGIAFTKKEISVCHEKVLN